MADFKGFVGGVFGSHVLPKQAGDCFDLGVFALSCGRIAEAYLYFWSLTNINAPCCTT